MASVIATAATLDDFLKAEAAAPGGARLALIDGEIVEWRANMTTRNSKHASTMMRMAFHLHAWAASRARQPVVIAGGAARCRLTRNPDRVVGLDLAVFFGVDHQHASCYGEQFEGPPAVTIEILSGSDTHEDIVDRIRVFLEARVQQVWIVDAELRRVTINRPDGEATVFTARHLLTAEPELPGFSVLVESLFPDQPVTAVDRPST